MITDGQLLAVAELRTVLHWLETGSGLVACVLSAIRRASESALDWLRVSRQVRFGYCWPFYTFLNYVQIIKLTWM